MAARSVIAHSSLFTLLQALWVLTAVQPASAQVALPPNFISADVPHDVPTGLSASIQDLAIFAWREFIALNWVAMDPATTGMRGRPNINDPTTFSASSADRNGNFPLLVWHTYRHKNELFPANGQTDPKFDSSTVGNSALDRLHVQPSAGRVRTREYRRHRRLSISSTISTRLAKSACASCLHTTPHASSTRPKVNRSLFDYANKNKLTKSVNPGAVNPLVGVKNYPELSAATKKTKDNLAQYGGICRTDPSIVSLPCGDTTVAGDAGEGAIEIKAAWRQLTVAEARQPRPVSHAKQSFIYTGPPNRTGGITMRSTGWSPFTLSIKQNRFRHLCSRAGSRLTITMMRPTRTPRI